MTKFLSVISQLISEDNILVLGHVMPDGDDISSVASLAEGLRRLGKKVRAAIDDQIPWYYKLFFAVDSIESFEQLQDFHPDLIVVVDCSSPDRVGRFQHLLKNSKTIVIDHHETNSMFGDLNFVDVTSASTAQIVYNMNKAMGVVYDPELATTNYLGIATDTGFFKYSNTDANVLKIAAELVELGAKPYFVASVILENKTPQQFKLLAKMIEHMKIEGELVYSWLSYEDYLSLGCNEDDSSGFVSELRSMKDIEVAILFTEFPKGEVHVSFRSKQWLNVSKIASALGGGGHARAAGCSYKNVELEKVIDEVLSLTREAMVGGRHEVG
ncbi:phosphoesterase [Pseudothermotoga hypogea DSM 11164 = NBRC 106472]|uniref:Phosphoesterase n=1 Tax=Pseudothermotoga hypogea DSM 11164 = NBRC 106472 TaxID=1123384 RepID=A0A0X1KTG3_9THEM|nr:MULTISPECIES: bifunctional oligoribonuclease/PAP phosphatase NrnA [Pseudothermotoga]AJC74555.1 phosphoesterase [Pseudothermotoga hypogea DSM 11164 = NBRC 106472]MDI6862135.1 bifunctional oligoribonuclease/PAP phosphatase NrnA [Pseudothermotoga sp.]